MHSGSTPDVPLGGFMDSEFLDNKDYDFSDLSPEDYELNEEIYEYQEKLKERYNEL